MCGRFVSASSPGEIADYFDATTVAETLTEPNFNVAPSVDIPVIIKNEHVRQLDLMRWGLIPFWAKSASIGNKMINAPRRDGHREKCIPQCGQETPLHHPG